ncbi:sensor histidine kinase N-terminal domain-containing protein [Ideonella sp. DXS22W]|uniref:histidine kinase n=1 Tax=Pseudaquabacterium inlustre TaxID=2984192 RepID=A0ABU9CJW3_9BURK
MRWNPIPGATLRTRLLAMLLPGLSGVLALGLWTTRGDAVHAANAAFDRSLLGAIKSMDLSVSTASGGLSVEQPYRLFEFFELTASGPVHFRVATDDGLVEIGSPDLPPPPQPLADGQPQFYDAQYLDQPVRIGALRRPLDPPVGDARHVLIQVAETTGSRERFTATFVQRALLRDAGVLGVLVLAVAWASAWALRPVRRLAEATRRRAADDLRALPATGLPSDLVPLVDAINQQVARTSALLAQRRQFLDDASHQLRTPLTTLRAQLDYALRETDPARSREAIDALSRELAHATRATNQLLALARADAGVLQPERVELRALAREVALALLPQARALGVDFGVEADEQAVDAVGDRLQLREALSNLAHNALVHGMGPVTLEAAAEPGGGWRLGVVDAGPGLPPEVLARLGERFVKGRGSRGAGLGLSMARAVAERHGGRLQAGPGEGGRGLRVALHWGPA